MSNMEPWTRQLLSVIVSQLCKTIGWHSISTTCLHVLVDVLHRYLKQLGTNIHDYTEHFNHTFPALEEIHFALADMGINIEDLREYVDYVTPIPIKTKAPKYPLEKKSNMNFLKPGSREVVTRPVHIHEHLPAMYPELSEDSYASQDGLNDDSRHANSSDHALNSSFKKAGDSTDSVQHKRITDLMSEHLGRPVRELSCVMMTTSGFLSPAREGKMPEARLPKVQNYNNHIVVNQPSTHTPVPPEVTKNEHKKSTHSKSSSKSAERKAREEKTTSLEGSDDTKVKKLASMKELSKLRAFKPTLNKSAEGPDVAKAVRPEKLKIPEQVSPKEAKPPKPPKPEKQVEKLEPQPEEKLATEPNKQKLNIFRRITKVKEDRSESPVPKASDDKNASINDSIESVIKRSVEREEAPKSTPKEKFQADPQPQQLVSKSKLLVSTKRLKGMKKLNRNGPPSAKKAKLNHEVTSQQAVEIPKATEPEPPPYPFFAAPGLMPPSLKSNLLIPQFPHPFINMKKRDPNCPHPEMPNLPIPPLMMATTATDSSSQKSPVKSVENDTNRKLDPAVLGLSDKKLKKKMKKNKREKDKKKRNKKDNLKNKEKLGDEKKKERISKKVKNKLKLKKKEKLNLQKTETEDPSLVPKLKLIINGPNSPQPSTSGLMSPKIVIKPIVKHDEPFEPAPAVKEERLQSPELAKISALVGKPSKQKSQQKVSVEPLVEPTTITLSTKPKKSVTNENKSKNKEKQKQKKVDESKHRIEPYYYDAEGNQVWVCPTCGGPDDGSPMIGCDGCDAWYHWVCVGIKSAPESAKWFCGLCRSAN